MVRRMCDYGDYAAAIEFILHGRTDRRTDKPDYIMPTAADQRRDEKSIDVRF